MPLTEARYVCAFAGDARKKNRARMHTIGTYRLMKTLLEEFDLWRRRDEITSIFRSASYYEQITKVCCKNGVKVEYDLSTGCISAVMILL
jgi:hypothetical protein